MRFPEDEFDLERDFPLGHGTADTSADVVCPYCGESITVAVDPGSGEHQEYIEDCAVCCRPWQVTVAFDGEGAARITATPLD